MCGIVGLFLKTDKHQSQLGELTSAMLATMTDRGPDSAGFAVYGGTVPGIKITVRAADRDTLARAVAGLEAHCGTSFGAASRDTHAVLTLPADREAEVHQWLAANAAGVDVVSTGSRMEIYKEVGLPADVARRFDLASMSGTHAIGHTRMATESAVTTNGAHPFSTGADQCLVHNGSLSNHNGLRRMLKAKGQHFATENDTEVAAGYLTWRMKEGDSLKQALESSLTDLDVSLPSWWARGRVLRWSATPSPASRR